MEAPEFCHCSGCVASIPPGVGASTAEHAAHVGYLRRLAAIGALPDPAFQPYPQPVSERSATAPVPW